MAGRLFGTDGVRGLANDELTAELALGIAASAVRVLSTRGVGALSVRTVAAEAGLATGSLRRAFPTQDALLVFSLELVSRRE